MDRNKVKAIQAAANDALRAVADRYGCSLIPSGGSFSEGNAMLKFQFAEIASNGEVRTKAAETFKRCAHLWGLSASDLGRSFYQGGERYEITGANTSAYKYPILGKNRAGKTYKFMATTVKAGLI